MVKTLIHPTTGRTVRLGRTADPKRMHARIEMARYVKAALPNAPDPVNYIDKNMGFLSEVLHNDTLGCCTCAGIVHIEGSWQRNAGAPIGVGAWTALWLYEKACGYVPGDASTDQGGNEEDVMAYVRKEGMNAAGGHKIAGWAAVHPGRVMEIMQAQWLFENLYFGVSLPDEWITPFPSANGFVWDVAGPPNPDNGHAFCGLASNEKAVIPGFNSKGVVIDTWGLLGTITWAAIAKYCDNAAGGDLWTILSHDSIANATAKAPNGMDYADLARDLASV